MAIMGAKILGDPGGICIGALPDGRLLIDKESMHIRVTGPTGSGKTYSFYFPTLLRTWKGSAIVHDRKGDFWLLLQSSSSWRHNLLFAPTLAESARYNPMARIGMSADDQISGFQNLVGLLPHSDPDHQAKEPIWDQNSMALVVSMMLFLQNFGKPEERNLGGLRDFHETGKEGGERMMRQEHPDPSIRREIANGAAKIWKNTNERYVGSILATIDSYLAIYARPNVRAAVSTCEFTVDDLVCGDYPTLLNLYLPPDHSERLAPVVRMMTSQILNTLMAHQDKVGEHWKRHHMLFALDEFNRFGTVKSIEGAMADMRSYKCRVMLGAQSDAILAKIYGESSLIFNNSRLVALRPMDYDEAAALSKRIGDVEVVAEADNSSYGDLGERRGGGLSRSYKRVPIMPPEKVLRMSKEDVLVSNYMKPIKVQRPALSVWQSLVSPAPRSWEPLDCEMLPIRSDDGKLLDQPAAVGDRNPWDGIKFEEPPPPPPEEAVEPAAKTTAKPDRKSKAKDAAVAVPPTMVPTTAISDLFDPWQSSPKPKADDDGSDNAPPADDDERFA